MKKSVYYIVLIILLSNCKKESNPNLLFSFVPSSESNITFENTITENSEINVIDFQYCYNGGGVGVGDFNNDNLPDLVFTGNQVASKIYLNLGDMKFQDISEASNFKTYGWVTGVSIVDINADGFDDIYLNVGGPKCNSDCKNLLFINRGLKENKIPHFTEEASRYGLDDGNYSQQTVFFDYDLDGDLDAYIVHNGNTNRDRNIPLPKKYFPKHLGDYLLENKTKQNSDQVHFTKVSDSLGITHKGFGLGITVNDLNNDHFPDIYISNDFITNDLIYLNQGLNEKGNTKGYKEINQQILSKQTYNAMGVDIADINNDQFPDIVVLDMLPKNYERQKKMLGFNNYDKFLLSQKNGYTPQYVHNTLQIHNGILDNEILPSSEISHAAGIASTDWSWAPLIADFDNDGNKDIFITNGYVKDITDLDFINYSDQNNLFGTPSSRKEKLKHFVDQLPGIHIPNVLYRNKGDQTFEDMSNEWMKDKNSFSNGASYADLDMDGDLDLIVSNINAPAYILKNNTSEKEKNFLRIRLLGKEKNKKGIGAKVTLWSNNTIQTQYNAVIKGYLSSVEPILHFGLPSKQIDSIQVVWPDKSVTIKKDIVANQLITISHNISKSGKVLKPQEKLFKKDLLTLPYAHKENRQNDYRYQPLIPHQFNANGPCIIANNINDKPGEEIFIGGSKGTPGILYAEDNSGTYQPIQEFDTEYEDTATLFIDIDNDGDQDLYVGSGGTDSNNYPNLLKDRIYINNGHGTFDPTPQKTQFYTNTSCLAKNDIDQDGDQDIFVGGGILPGKYPLSSPSFILKNEQGKFTTNENLKFPHRGIITDAVWANINQENTKELIVAGHWMPITIYTIEKNKVKEIPVKWKTKQGKHIDMSGWWNTVTTADFDNDGDIDLIAGNQGTNGFIKPSFNKPIYVYKEDLDKNGSIDPVLAQYFETEKGVSLKPIHTRDDIMKQLVFLKKEYGTYQEFANASFQELLRITDLDSQTLKAHLFDSVYAENIGNNTFVIHPLPSICQLSPINDFLIQDFDQDGFKDVLIVGNNYSAEANYGRHDAIIGIYLKGSQKGFIPIKNMDTGFVVPKQSNHIISIKNRNKEQRILATQNNDSICVFKVKNKLNKALVDH